MPYEVFKKTGARVETPTIALTTDGRMAINAAAVRILVEAGIRSVLLLWDKDHHTIALKAASKGDKNAFTVSITPDKHAGSLRAKSFLNHVGWKASGRQVLPAIWNERERMLEIALPLANLAAYQLDPLPEEDLTAEQEQEIDLYLRNSHATVPLTVDQLYRTFSMRQEVRSPRKTREFMESFLTGPASPFKEVRIKGKEPAYIQKRGS